MKSWVTCIVLACMATSCTNVSSTHSNGGATARIEVGHAVPSEIAMLVCESYGARCSRSGLAGAGSAASLVAQHEIADQFRITADDENRCISVTGNYEDVANILKLLGRLDAEAR